MIASFTDPERCVLLSLPVSHLDNTPWAAVVASAKSKLEKSALVTDEMVERAWFAMSRAENLDHRSMGFGKESMRAALEAALNGDGSS